MHSGHRVCRSCHGRRDVRDYDEMADGREVEIEGRGMNAREQMQALIDGKVIACGGDYYKLDDKGNLIICIDPMDEGRWKEMVYENFVISDENYIFDETKCVDFAHALGMMAQGKAMKCLLSDELFRIADGALQVYGDDRWFTIAKGELLSEDEMESMWMEEEE